MFTVTKSSSFTESTVLIEAVCLSTDSKPTTGIANGSVCIEMNTGKIFMYNETGSTWVELQ